MLVPCEDCITLPICISQITVEKFKGLYSFYYILFYGRMYSCKAFIELYNLSDYNRNFLRMFFLQRIVK